MSLYTLGFLAGLGTAVMLYALYRIAREFWFDLEMDVMTAQVRAEMGGDK